MTSETQQQMTDETKTIYDDAFTVTRQRWGTFVSRDLEGNGLVTSMSEEQCVAATRWYLKARQEGFEDAKTYESVVGGKL